MKILTGLFLFLFIALIGCQDPKSTSAPLDNSAKADAKQEIRKLNGYLKKYEKPSQVFKVSTDKTTQVKGKKGTIIIINPSDLETINGQPLGKTIQVELKELTSQKELLQANAQTVSNGRLLISGGAYYINMTIDGQQLKLKTGKSLSVEFPKLTNTEMALFYGQRDSLDQMNWQQAGQKFESRPKVKQQIKTRQDSDTSIGDLDAILDYIESESKRPLTAEEKRQIDEQKKNAALADKVYKAVEIKQFGWINCDRFYDEPNKTDVRYVFNGKDSVTSANVYLIFQNINSVMQSQYFSFAENKFNSSFQNLPVGSKVKLIAVSLKNDKTYSFRTDLQIVPNKTILIKLEESSEQQLEKLFN